ncbi:MAG: hypothetical protein HYR55_15540 [Acidobacteria bacterium]|nr:hypothetical protein [Acidobacteriota bacterium]MBI3658208.1 hypothetical protein [Acidobacteriota bacterium]
MTNRGAPTPSLYRYYRWVASPRYDEFTAIADVTGVTMPIVIYPALIIAGGAEARP